jgi:hypothetical protein
VAKLVVVAVAAVGDHCTERDPGVVGPAGQNGGERGFGLEVGVVALLGEVVGGGVGDGVQGVVQAGVGPHRGHGDDAVVGLAVAAQPLASHVRGGGAVLAVPGVVDDQHALVVRGGGGVGQQQFDAPVVDPLVLPGGLGQEELQPLDGRVLGTGHRFGVSQAGQRLVPVSRRQQSGEVLAEAAPLGQRDQKVIEAGRVLLQRTRCGRARPAFGHQEPPCSLRKPQLQAYR